MKNNIVKARERHGTSSLDLTIPAKIKNNECISGGDLFKVESIIKDDKLQIIYTRIYKNE